MVVVHTEAADASMKMITMISMILLPVVVGEVHHQEQVPEVRALVECQDQVVNLAIQAVEVAGVQPAVPGNPGQAVPHPVKDKKIPQEKVRAHLKGKEKYV